jgi:hypothetical protein
VNNDMTPELLVALFLLVVIILVEWRLKQQRDHPESFRTPGVEVVFHTVEGSGVTIANFDQDSLQPLLEAYTNREPVIQVNLDDGIAYFNRDNITRIDVN